VADSQYCSKRVRSCIVEYGAESVIPFMANQRRGEAVLRVDRKFRTSGLYVERVNSRRVCGFGVFEA